MFKKLGIIIVFYILNLSVSNAQISIWNSSLLKNYIVDGQEYTLVLEDSNLGKVYMNFFDGYQYRVLICSETTKNYKVTLYDIEKKLLFSGSCDDYIKYLDLKFDSNIACYVEISVADPKPKQQFKVVIGFKESNTAK